LDSNDHQCPWREEVAALRRVVADLTSSHRREIEELHGKLAAAVAALEALERRVLGPKSEKMPPPASEIRRTESKEDAEARRLLALERRRQRAALKQKLQRQTVIHHLSDEAKQCPKCGGVAERPLGEGKRTTVYEYVPGYFVRQEHMQEKCACRCGQHIATADPPPRALDKSQYGAGFIAHLIVMKCADSIPLHRLAKQYQRLGIPMARSTLTDLFHAAAAKLEPLWKRLLRVIAQSQIVQADETSLKMQRPNKRGFVWTFLSGTLIAYRFADNRSGETPVEVLGGTAGTLVVDAHTGYNRVTEVEGRDRSGCLSHIRRKIFDALSTAPDQARHGLELILDVYRVEHEAKARNIVRTPEHLAMRQTRSREAMERLYQWLVEEQPKHLPKGPFGSAISYALNQWERVLLFLDNANIPVDNNASESALRIVALNRKNWLFVGDVEAGEHYAILASLVATCEANEIDPIAYLKDVLMRVDTHPASRIDELLPQNWKPPIRWTETINESATASEIGDDELLLDVETDDDNTS
jgi:transposase